MVLESLAASKSELEELRTANAVLKQSRADEAAALEERCSSLAAEAAAASARCAELEEESQATQTALQVQYAQKPSRQRGSAPCR